MTALSTGADCGVTPAPGRLDGRHVALLSLSELDPSAEVFAHAARALGARIAHIAPADLGLDDAERAADTARLLGRLYAAIGCFGLDAPSVALLKHACGIPVLADLAADTHPSRLLADVMTLQQRLRDVAVPGRPRLGVYGSSRSGLLRAWKKIAPAAGVDVIGLSRRGTDAHVAGCHFICRPGVPPELLALQDGGPGDRPHETSLAAQQRSQHERVVQALLCSQADAPAIKSACARA